MSINKYNSTSGELERIDGIIATDATPTSGSTNPVQSGGVYTALAGKQNTLTFDTTPTNASTNPVTSGGIYTALGTKANESMIGDAWTASTTYGVTGNTSGYPVYCINDNVLYKCIQEHTGAAYEPPNATYWEATDVNTEITALNNSLMENFFKSPATMLPISLGDGFSVRYTEKTSNLAGSSGYMIVPLGSVGVQPIILSCSYVQINNVAGYPISGLQNLTHPPEALRDDASGTVTGTAYQYYLKLYQNTGSASYPVIARIWYIN